MRAAQSHVTAIDHALGWSDVQKEKPLTETQKQVLELIREAGPIMGKQICQRIGGNGSSLRTHIIPALKPHGVRSSGTGYYIE